jgi:elongation factor G
MPQANPVLLEPIGALKVTVPDGDVGDIMGDLNKRRGRVMGMTPNGDGTTTVEAEVPMAEMGTYAIDLRSMNQGGVALAKFERYEEAPPMVSRWSSRKPRLHGRGRRIYPRAFRVSETPPFYQEGGTNYGRHFGDYRAPD